MTLYPFRPHRSAERSSEEGSGFKCPCGLAAHVPTSRPALLLSLSPLLRARFRRPTLASSGGGVSGSGGRAAMAVAAPGQLNLDEFPSWGSRGVDCFEKLEQIGEGTYGFVPTPYPTPRFPLGSSNSLVTGSGT
jgi:hypothetical protein